MKFPPKTARFARTPPAIFPSIFGSLGLGIAWRRSAESYGLTMAVSDMILGTVFVLFLFGLVAYAAKVMQRSGVLREDLQVLPGRAGVVAASLSLALSAAMMLRFSPELARVLLALAMISHISLAGLVIHTLLSGPAERRVITPVWHLSFVGFILLPLSAAPLGYTALSEAILWGTLAIAALVYGVSLGQLLRRGPPPPLRPFLAIHLAPVSLFATVSMLLDKPGIAWMFAAAATVLVVVMTIKARYLTAGGFTPLWGAFTFPLSAYAGMMSMLAATPVPEGAPASLSVVVQALSIVALASASVIVPLILYRVLKLWPSGQLAAKTNAATA